MFARRLALRQCGILKRYNLASSIIRRTQPFQTQRSFRIPANEDKPAYEYDPHKHQSAKPIFIPGPKFSGRSGIFLLILGAGGTIFYFSNIEEVPITGRKRFNCFDQHSAEEQGAILYQDLMNTYKKSILPSWDPRVAQVERVLTRLLPVVSKLGIEGSSDGWEVHVIDEPRNSSQNHF